MQCEQCGQRPAAIHLTQIVDNSVTTVHLCEQCAADKGVQTDATLSSKLPISGFLAGMGQGAAAALPAGGEELRCAFCRATLQDFRETGRLGCSHCYDTFEPQLRDLLRRIHGASQHVGEVYLVPSSAVEGQARESVGRLREQLRRAVDAENFELAAELRDRIRGME